MRRRTQQTRPDFRFKAVVQGHDKADDRDAKHDAEDGDPGRHGDKKPAGAEISASYVRFKTHCCATGNPGCISPRRGRNIIPLASGYAILFESTILCLF